MIQICNEKTDFDGSVVVVQPIEQGMCDMLEKQNCLYTHVIRGVEGVEKKTQKNISEEYNLHPVVVSRITKGIKQNLFDYILEKYGYADLKNDKNDIEKVLKDNNYILTNQTFSSNQFKFYYKDKFNENVEKLS